MLIKTDMRDVIFIHGWGFDGSVWEKLIPLLPGIRPHYIELGFADAERAVTTIRQDHAIVIGHSLGVLWYLKNHPSSAKALISIAGFDCFTTVVGNRVLRAMKAKLGKCAEDLLQDFWAQCGVNEPGLKQFDVQRLDDGLGWLQKWNCEPELQNLNCPKLALAAQDDQIVAIEKSRAIWGGDLCETETGGHVLPLTKPEWCAEKIQEFFDHV